MSCISSKFNPGEGPLVKIGVTALDVVFSQSPHLPLTVWAIIDTGVVKLLGYGSLNGASITLISTLGKYGLLEGRGDEVRVSDDAIAIVVEEPGAPDRVAALRRAALRPELFAELSQSFAGDPLPGDNAIRIRLEKMGFTAKAASVAARSFRETAELVTAESGAYNVPHFAEYEGDRGGSMSPAMTATPQPAMAQPSIPATAQGFKQDIFTLAEEQVVLRWPEPLTRESCQDFEDWLNLALKKVKRAAGVN